MYVSLLTLLQSSVTFLNDSYVIVVLQLCFNWDIILIFFVIIDWRLHLK